MRPVAEEEGEIFVTILKYDYQIPADLVDMPMAHHEASTSQWR